MRVVIQRALEASVWIEGNEYASIGPGFLIFIGIEGSDTEDDAKWLATKIGAMRVFTDVDGKMNRALKEVEGKCLVISQFTLHASTKKGNRPSFIRAARPDHALPLYQLFLKELSHESGVVVESGVFGSEMKVSLINDGPVTILMDSKGRE